MPGNETQNLCARVETLASFSAVALAIVLEGAVMHRIDQQLLTHSTPDRPLGVVGERTGLIPPQGWVVEAVLVRIFRIHAGRGRPACQTDRNLLRLRQALAHLWCVAIAVVAVQALLPRLGREAGVP